MQRCALRAFEASGRCDAPPVTRSPGRGGICSQPPALADVEAFDSRQHPRAPNPPTSLIFCEPWGREDDPMSALRAGIWVPTGLSEKVVAVLALHVPPWS
eukprot:1277872-Alexandrium_andersonii.AAC.1